MSKVTKRRTKAGQRWRKLTRPRYGVWEVMAASYKRPCRKCGTPPIVQWPGNCTACGTYNGLSRV
jgi:hypothetical protein